jgi:two-component system response regulator YesN
LQTCAEAIDLNYSYLSRVFKQQWGQSFSKYLSELRIDYAKLLLSISSCSVNEVARQSGFANYNYFFRVFKERVGISPYQFNRNIMDYE